MQFEEFTLSCYVNAPAEDVFLAWVTSGKLEKWFLNKADYIGLDIIARPKNESCKVGDSYWFEWIEKTVETGKIIDVSGRSFTFTFGDDVHVKVSVTEEERTLVSVKQTHTIVSEAKRQQTYANCIQGWTFYLANLKSVLEGGLDLRERKVTRKDLINV
jgi:uncharacterized protein YndB with AHSA1/START domain